ncbi:hypothetical protein VNI00_016196 [Paramarasmius palmivorus]|uniref:Uncharacterized protein n=1 Tax=Paramarasmius palmivorus TaxID=297713 RepID=A0AAW0BEM3_9AGAR
MPSSPPPLLPLVVPPRLGSPDWGYAYERQSSEASSVNPEADTELDRLRKENSDLRKHVDHYKHNMQCLNCNFGDRQATVHRLRGERNELRATLADPQDRRISDLEQELAEIASIGMRYYMADALPFVQDLQGAIRDIQSRANFGLPNRVEISKLHYIQYSSSTEMDVKRPEKDEAATITVTNTLCDQLHQQLGGQFNNQLQARDRRISDLEQELAEIASIGMRYYMADALPFVQDLQGAIRDIQSRANFGLPNRVEISKLHYIQYSSSTEMDVKRPEKDEAATITVTNTLCDQLHQQLGGQFNNQLQARDRRISDLEQELAEIASIGMRYYMADALPFVQDLQGAIRDIWSRANFGLPNRGSMVDEEEEAWVCDTLLDIEHLAGRTTHLLEDATALVGMFRPSHSCAHQEDLARLSTYAGDYYRPGGAYGIALNNPLCQNGEAAAEAQEDESNDGDEEDGENEG